MRSIVTVTTPATVERLTTVERIQADLGITGSETEIEVAINEASSRIEAELGYHLALETVIERFRSANGSEAASAILLDRTPVVSIDSITVDDNLLVEGAWELDPVNGLLLCLTSGMSMWWKFSNTLSVSYSGGWVMPGEEGRTLPPAIESACAAYVRSIWFSRRRDPLVKSIEVPDVISYDYWVGSTGADAGVMPPDVSAMLAPFKRLRV